MTTFLTWRAEGATGLEGARILRATGGFRALGRLVRAVDGAPFSASYRLVIGEDGAVSRLSVTSATVERERHLTLNRTEDGYWLLDTGAGAAGTRAAFDGAVDVEVEFSPVFTALPVRRLGLHREAGEASVNVVRVALPDLAVDLVERRFRTVAVLDGGRATVAVGTEQGEVVVSVDDDAIVLDHPGTAVRLPAAAHA